MESIGERLKRIMKEKKISIKTLSEVSGIPYNTIYHYRHELSIPNIYNFFDIAEALEVNPNYLYYGVEK